MDQIQNWRNSDDGKVFMRKFFELIESINGSVASNDESSDEELETLKNEPIDESSDEELEILKNESSDESDDESPGIETSTEKKISILGDNTPQGCLNAIKTILASNQKFGNFVLFKFEEMNIFGSGGWDLPITIIMGGSNWNDDDMNQAIELFEKSEIRVFERYIDISMFSRIKSGKISRLPDAYFIPNKRDKVIKLPEREREINERELKYFKCLRSFESKIKELSKLDKVGLDLIETAFDDEREDPLFLPGASESEKIGWLYLLKGIMLVFKVPFFEKDLDIDTVDDDSIIMFINYLLREITKANS